MNTKVFVIVVCIILSALLNFSPGGNADKGNDIFRKKWMAEKAAAEASPVGMACYRCTRPAQHKMDYQAFSSYGGTLGFCEQHWPPPEKIPEREALSRPLSNYSGPPPASSVFGSVTSGVTFVGMLLVVIFLYRSSGWNFSGDPWAANVAVGVSIAVVAWDVLGFLRN